MDKPNFLIFLLSCFIFPIQIYAQNTISLNAAIEQSAEDIATSIPRRTRVAIVAFSSPNDNFSNYLMEELTGVLVKRGIEVADRQNLEFVYKELGFQMSGYVSDDSANSIGKFLGADFVITGEMTDIGNSYCFAVNTVHNEVQIMYILPLPTGPCIIATKQNSRNFNFYDKELEKICDHTFVAYDASYNEWMEFLELKDYIPDFIKKHNFEPNKRFRIVSGSHLIEKKE